VSGRLSLVVTAVLMCSACRTSGTAMQGGVVGASIGDDVCALMLEYDLTVSDTHGRPVSDVELWRVGRFHVQGKAFRIGTTDATGHLLAPDCYMGTLEFQFWHPEEEPVRLDLMLLREGFGLKRMRLAPPTQEVLSTGNVLGVTPGRSFEWSQVKRSAERKAYRVVTSVTLESTRQ
jgi:hypothetical protein